MVGKGSFVINSCLGGGVSATVRSHGVTSLGHVNKLGLWGENGCFRSFPVEHYLL